MPVTVERVRELLNYDPETGVFSWADRQRSDFSRSQGYASWRRICQGKSAGSREPNGYIRIAIGGKHYLAHRLAWVMVHGRWPTDQIDHINGDRSDNRIANLRDVSNAENRRNMRMHSRNTSGVTGVRFDPRYGSWHATIWQNAKSIYLGRFETRDEAAIARNRAASALGYHPNHGLSRPTTTQGE